MAVPQNGVNTKDKVVTEMPVPMEKNKSVTYNPDAFQLMSDYIIEPDMRFISESQEIQQVGCIHRDTVVTPKATTSSVVFIPDVRLVDKLNNEGDKVGLMYIHKSTRAINEPPSKRLR